MYELGINVEKLFAEEVASPKVEFVAELRESDLDMLGEPTPGGVTRTPEKMRERHHALARALASGMKEYEAAALVGYEPQYVSLLKRSPAFLDLIDLYTAQEDAEFAGLVSQFEGLTKDAMILLRERMEEEPESISMKMALETVKVAGDRAGYAPVQRSETLNVNMTLAEKLALARKRVEERMIDVTPEAKSG